MRTEYSINLYYPELSVLKTILEASMHRQLNFIAQHKRDIANLDEKIIKVKEEISNGKKGFFSNPKSKLDELMIKRNELEKAMTEPKRFLFYTREIYRKIFDELERIEPGDGKLLNLDYFKDREHVLSGSLVWL